MDKEKSLSRQDSKHKAARVRGVKLWTQFSPLRLLRVLRDTYVKSCVTVGDSSQFNAVAHSVAFRISSSENSFSRSNSSNCRDDFGSAQDILDFSAKFSREVLEQESVQSGPKHLATVTAGHNGSTLADLRGYVGHSGSVRVRPSFDSVPESEQYTDSNASRMSLDVLLQTSATHSTGFLHPPSRRAAALSGCYLPRASSRRRERFSSVKSASMPSSLSAPVALVCDLPRSSSGKTNRPNPYRLFDTRLPSPAPTV